MATLLLRSFGLLALFQLLAVSVLVAGRRGRSTIAALVLLGGLVTVGLVTGDFEAPLFLSSAVVAGWMTERGIRAGRSLWPTAAAAGAPVMLAALFGLASPNPRQAWTDLSAQVDSLAGAARVPVPASPSPTPEERRVVEESRRLASTASRWALRLVPGEIFVMALLQVLPLVLVGGRLAQRAGMRVAVLPASHWQVPFASIWGLAIGLGLLVVPVEAARIAGANIVFVVAACLAVQGHAVLWSWLERALPSAARTLLLASLVLAAWPFLLAALVLVGTADLWIDFRRLRTATEAS